MTLLDDIHHPRDVQKLTPGQLKQLAGEIRQRILDVVSRNGGHLASNLGVTELVIALHYCFDFEKDRLLWDVGHQCYPHKLLTGRHARFDSLRQSGGISGFPNIDESSFDLFNVGHAGTAIATALGLAHADKLSGRDGRVISLVGDASIVNGLSFEGMNQAGLLDRQFMVILNDNSWGIAPTPGALAETLAKIRTSSYYEEFKQRAKHYLPKVPLVGQSVVEALGHIKETIKATVSPLQIFEQLGFMYVGPIDGHNLNQLIEMLKLLGDVQHPVLLHVHTNKGHGADFAIAEPGRFHSPLPFMVKDGKVTPQKTGGRSWTSAFSDALLDLAAEDERVVAITAGMPDGTGLDHFAQKYPDRYFDVGIAESCAVDMAAGMARAGLKPVVAIYSTFMQRAFDQIFQEISLQGLPITLCLDRAGLVGGDGAVHHGFLDISYLRGLPNMIMAAPADENELRAALRFAARQNTACALRYPRDDVPRSFGEAPPFDLGRCRLMHKGTDATLLAYGTTVRDALDAAELLAAKHVYVRVYNARFAKPVDQEMVLAALTAGHPVLTIEDHSVVGGFGSAVLETAQELRLPTDRIVRLGIPGDRFIRHGSREAQLTECGLDPAGIAAVILRELEQDGPRPPKTATRERIPHDLHRTTDQHATPH